jgi:Domain of unknown function (DUF6378)
MNRVSDEEMMEILDQTPKKPRGTILAEAEKVINGERQDVYGSPEDSFGLIAYYWNIYLNSKGVIKEDSEIIKSDIAMMMVLFKIAREANQHKRDNVVDAAGYLGIYGDMA